MNFCLTTTKHCIIILKYAMSFTLLINQSAEGGSVAMSEVRVNKNESFENALKRFKRQCARAGVMNELKKREHYEKPSVKKRKKSEAARKAAHKKRSY